MKLSSTPFKIRDYKKDCFKITLSGDLKGGSATILRNEIEQCIDSNYDVIYLDTTGVTDIDLSIVNEIIHTHYVLEKATKKLIFLYRQGSVVEQWIETTGMDKFVATAMIPADS